MRIMTRNTVVIILILAGLVVVGGGWVLYDYFGASVKVRTLEHVSPVIEVEQVYRAMTGPSTTEALAFPHFEPPELLWVVGCRAEVVGEDGETPAPQEFMGHASLDFDTTQHATLFELPVYDTNRLFTLSQGQQEIRFPKGFGLPFYSDEQLRLTTQLLKVDPGDESQRLRYKISVDYVLDRDLDRPFQPLYVASGWGLALPDGASGAYTVERPDGGVEGASCLPGEAVGPDADEDGARHKFAGHWVVKPGRGVNRTPVTQMLNLAYDTMAHYIAVHLHPFAESVELRDLSTGETVYKSEAEGLEDKIGLKRVGYFSSEVGVPLHADHEYELVSTYNNTTSEDQDSAAVMLLYLADRKLQRRPRHFVSPVEIAHVATPVKLSEERVLLHTNHGEILIALYPEAAPKHTEQILNLTRLGVYDTMLFYRVEPEWLIQMGFPEKRMGDPLTPEQLAAIKPLPAEFTDLTHRKGTVSMALHDNFDPNSAEASFFILLNDSPELDRQFTIVGRVVKGLDTLRTIGSVPLEGNAPLRPVVIEKAEVVTREELVARRKQEGQQ
jgi:cyclophilin family peptidyl-prolyl cis-trans isomerase